MRAYAVITSGMGFVGAALVMTLTVHEPLAFAGVVWSLAVLLVLVGVYAARARWVERCESSVVINE